MRDHITNAVVHNGQRIAQSPAVEIDPGLAVSGLLESCWLESAKSQVSKLQSIFCVANRLITRKRKFDPISDDILDKLHWLPVELGSGSRLVCWSTDVFTGMLHPSYRKCSLQRRMSLVGCQSLRSAARGDLEIPRNIEILDTAQGCSTFSQNTMFMYDSDVKFIDTEAEIQLPLKSFPEYNVSSLISDGWCEEGHPFTKNSLQHSHV